MSLYSKSVFFGLEPLELHSWLYSWHIYFVFIWAHAIKIVTPCVHDDCVVSSGLWACHRRLLVWTTFRGRLFQGWRYCHIFFFPSPLCFIHLKLLSINLRFCTSEMYAPLVTRINSRICYGYCENPNGVYHSRFQLIFMFYWHHKSF